MMDDGIRTNGLRVSLPTLGAISSIVGVVIFCGGWVFGYMTFKSDLREISNHITDLSAVNQAMQVRVNGISQSIVDDRQATTNRLTSLEEQAKYISQGVAELKIAVVPKR